MRKSKKLVQKSKDGKEVKRTYGQDRYQNINFSQYFIWCKANESIRPLWIKLLQLSGYATYFNEYNQFMIFFKFIIKNY